MDDFIVHIIVLAAALFLGRWLYKNIISSKTKTPACSSCDSCEPEAAPADSHAPATPTADQPH